MDHCDGEAGDEGSGWEMCARMLTLNSLATLEDFQEIATKILRNIFENPTEDKFKSLKLSNKIMESRILPVKGGLQYFLACGFSRGSNTTRNKVIALGSGAGLEGGLQSCLDWLRDTICSCRDIAALTGASNSAPCADTIIQLKFTSGLPPVLGGFTRHDTTASVLSFAKCFFTSERRAAVVLMLPESGSPLATMDWTLQRTGLCPRASLIATTTNRESREEKMREVRTEVVHDNSAQIESAERARQIRINAAKDRQDHRSKILQDFEADHKDRSER